MYLAIAITLYILSKNGTIAEIPFKYYLFLILAHFIVDVIKIMREED